MRQENSTNKSTLLKPFSCFSWFSLLLIVNTLLLCWVLGNMLFSSFTDITDQNFLSQSCIYQGIGHFKSKRSVNITSKSPAPLPIKTKGSINPFTPVEKCKIKKRISYSLLCKLNRAAYCESKEPADMISDFWVVAPLYTFNHTRTRLLYKLHNNFKDYISSFGISFCTIEGIRKDLNQSYLLTKPNKEPYDIQVVIYDEDYIRENLLNVAIRKLPPEWQYVAWIDAHQYFENSYWWEEAIIKMERNASVQLFQKGHRLNARNQTYLRNFAVMYLSLHQTSLDEKLYWIEYGNAYGIRRELYDKIEYIFDLCVAAGCDLTYVKTSIPRNMSFSLLIQQHPYSVQFEFWMEKTRSFFNSSRTFVRGEIVHLEHEHYLSYWQVPWAFYRAGFNISTDLVRDENFIIKIVKPVLREIMPNLGLKFYYAP